MNIYPNYSELLPPSSVAPEMTIRFRIDTHTITKQQDLTNLLGIIFKLAICSYSEVAELYIAISTLERALIWFQNSEFLSN